MTNKEMDDTLTQIALSLPPETLRVAPDVAPFLVEGTFVVDENLPRGGMLRTLPKGNT